MQPPLPTSPAPLLAVAVDHPRRAADERDRSRREKHELEPAVLQITENEPTFVARPSRHRSALELERATL